jgi:hypothetical protein
MVNFPKVKKYVKEMGGDVETFLSKFIIVWIDKGFADPEHKEEMDEYIDELNSYEFTKCKPYDTA